MRHSLVIVWVLVMLAGLPGTVLGASIFEAEGVTDIEGSNLSSYDYVHLLYRDQPGDGGGGMLYKNNSASWTTKNNGTRYIDNTGNKFERQLNQADTAINVKWFGATGDGSTDDLSAMQSAVEYAGEIGGGRIFIPDGEYYLQNNSITGVLQKGLLVRYSNITLEFESLNAVLAPRHTVLTRAITIAADTSSSPSNHIENIAIIGGRIDGGNNKPGGNTTEYAHGIDIRHATNVRIDGTTIHNCRGDGIYIAYGSEDVIINNVIIDGGGSGTVSGRRQGIAVLSGRNIAITGGRVAGSIIGIDVEIDQNQINNGYDFLENVSINGVKIANCSSEGVAYVSPLVEDTVDMHGFTVVNCQFTDISESIIEADVDTSAGTLYGVVIANNISKNSQTFKGIVIKNCQDVVIADNVMLNCADIALHIALGCDRVNITGGVYESSGSNALRLQENISNSRSDFVVSNGIFKTTDQYGPAGRIDGAYNISLIGNHFIGAGGGLSLRGSTTNGNLTRLVARVQGGLIQSTTTAQALTLDAWCRRILVAQAELSAASGASYCVLIDASAQASRFVYNEYVISNGTYTAATVISDGSANATIVDF